MMGKEFAEKMLSDNKIEGWTVRTTNATDGLCIKKTKEVLIGDGNNIGLIIHEVAHAISISNGFDGHCGFHADTMHRLFNDYIKEFIDG